MKRLGVVVFLGISVCAIAANEAAKAQNSGQITVFGDYLNLIVICLIIIIGGAAGGRGMPYLDEETRELMNKENEEYKDATWWDKFWLKLKQNEQQLSLGIIGSVAVNSGLFYNDKIRIDGSSVRQRNC